MKIPVTVAEEIARNHACKQVIVVALSDDGSTQHVVTYGKSIIDCDQAAQGGDFVKKALGWPESLNAMPNRVKRLQDEVKQLKKQLKEVTDGSE